MHVNFRIKYLGIILFLIAGYFILYNHIDILGGRSFCIFKFVTGIPCPACGSSRATLKLFQGEFKESLLINPLAIVTNIFIVISVFWMLKDVFFNKETYIPVLKKNWPLSVKIIGGVLIICNWIWNIYKGV